MANVVDDTVGGTLVARIGHHIEIWGKCSTTRIPDDAEDRRLDNTRLDQP
jgi:hypothetical protein